MARLEPAFKPLRRERDGIGPGDPDRVETELPGAFDEGALERLAA
jgi:hypothetical protein